MKTLYTILVLLVVNGVIYGQHMTFKDMKQLLDVAHSEEGIESVLTKLGYSNSGNDEFDIENGVKHIYYDKQAGKLTYKVTVQYSAKEDRYEVMERSEDSNLWKYYQKVAGGNGFKQFENKKGNTGETWTKYRNDDHELTLSKEKGLSGTYYLIILRRI